MKIDDKHRIEMLENEIEHLNKILATLGKVGMGLMEALLEEVAKRKKK